MTKPTYQKYGAGATPDFESLIKGQQAVSSSIKDAFTGVEGLLKKTQDVYKDRNTFNIQERLKKNIQQAGLRAEPVDRASIQQQFGNLIDMDQIDKTVIDETKRVQDDATDLASLAADKDIKEGGDALSARNKFSQTMQELGATEKFKSITEKEWSDNNATRFADMKILELREDQKLIDSFDQRLKESGIGASSVVMEGLLADVSEDKRPKLKGMLEERLQARQNLTTDQQFAFDNNLKEYDTMTELQNAEHNKQIEELTNQQAAHQSAAQVPQSTYNQLDSATKDFGDDVINAIKDELGWFNNGDVGEFNTMLQGLTNSGIPERDAAGMIAHVFKRTYSGGKWHGNNVTNREITHAKTLLNDLAINYKQSTDVGSQITSLKNQAAIDKIKRAQGRTKLARNMREVGQNKSIGFSQKRINDLFDNRQTFQEKLLTSTPAVGGATNETGVNKEQPKVSDNVTGDAITARMAVNRKRADQGEDVASVTPGTEQQSKDTRKLIGGKQITQQQHEQATAEVGDLLIKTPLKFINDGLNQLADVALEPGREVIAGLKSFQTWAKKGGWNQTDSKALEAFSKEDPVAAKTVTEAAIENSTEAKKAKIVEGLDGEDVKLSTSMLDSLAKMPSSTAAAKSTADRIKITQNKKDWPKIVAALRAGNPKLADQIAKLLKISIAG